MQFAMIYRMEGGNSRFKQIISALNDAGAEYVIVGGIATILHGYVRTTLDVDMIVAFDARNLDRLSTALQQVQYVPRMGVDPRGLADEATRESWRQRNMVVFSFVSLHNPPVLVDVFVHHPIPFEELARDSIWKDYYGVKVRICSLEHLLHLKRLSGRPKDLDDIESLEVANARKPS